jgi:tRNA(Ile)-lysidine synthase
MMLDILRQQLHDDFVSGADWCVALSGGVDSTALLHAVVKLSKEFSGNTVRAVHVNHHLHADADTWASACQSLCDGMGVPVICCDVTVATTGSDGTEAAARKVRYEALIGLLGDGEILLTAHHRDDQVETLLLRLLRGAGPHGLASIESRRSCGRGWLVRPLLDIGRGALETYAREQQLEWIEDPANIDTAFDRNFLRHRILPALRERWPGLGETLPRAVRLSAEASRMLDELAELDLSGTGNGAGHDDAVSIEVLEKLSSARQRNLVRYWLRRRGLTPPAEAKLRDGLRQLLTAGPDRMPMVKWGGVQMRRYRDRLYVLEFDPEPVNSVSPDARDWDGRGRIDLGPPRGGLRFVSGHGDDEGQEVDVPLSWVVRFRAGGERIAIGGQHKTVKNFFQEQGVVPWMRAHVPLLYRADQLVAIGDLWQAEDLGAEALHDDIRVAWDDHPIAL